jgi:hypothetical protein
VLDEADAFAPQKPQHEQARLLGAVEDLVRRGRARGIGVTLISQRPAVINKNVLTQIECLIALRMTAPQDIAAIKQWIHHHGSEDEQEKVLASLPSLPRGTAWFWSPGWLKVLRKIEFRKRRTFDSSATPSPGKIVTAPEQLAKVDLEALEVKLSTIIDRSKEDDPASLRIRIRDLEEKLKVTRRRVLPEVVEIERVPAKLYTEILESWRAMDEQTRSLETIFHDLGTHVRDQKVLVDRLGSIVERSRFCPPPPRKKTRPSLRSG